MFFNLLPINNSAVHVTESTCNHVNQVVTVLIEHTSCLATKFVCLPPQSDAYYVSRGVQRVLMYSNLASLSKDSLIAKV